MTNDQQHHILCKDMMMDLYTLDIEKEDECKVSKTKCKECGHIFDKPKEVCFFECPIFDGVRELCPKCGAQIRTKKVYKDVKS